MTTTPDPRIVRDFARRAILSAAEEVDYIGIGEQFGDDENWPAEEAAYDAMHEAVNAEWKKATVTVSWPDEQPKLRPEYGIRVVYTSTRMREEAISDSADDAREQAAKTAENRNVVSAVPIRRPVGDWEELSTDV